VIDGVQISGWLYWHINHWYIRIDKKEDNGNVTRITSLPHLRDNEWIRAEALEECRKQQKGYMEIGLRQGGKEAIEEVENRDWDLLVNLIAGLISVNEIMKKENQLQKNKI